MSPRPQIQLTRCDATTIPLWLSLTNKTFLTPFANETQAFLSVFYPSGLTPAIHSWALASHLSAVEDIQHEFYFIAYDISSGPDPVAVGAVRWVYQPARTLRELDTAERDAATARERDAFTAPEGIEHARFEDFRVAQAQARRRCVEPNAYLYLKVVSVLPEYQRRGAGREMLRWGTAWADWSGCRCFLEASPVGVGLYEKEGFEGRGKMEWDARRYEGVEDEFAFVAMVREPTVTTGEEGAGAEV